MNDFFRITSETGLSEILALRAYAFRVNKEVSNQSVDVVFHSDNTISVNKVSLSVNSLTSLFHKSILAAGDLLFKQLLLKFDFLSELSFITLKQAADFENQQNKKTGQNFLTNNSVLKNCGKFLEQKVISDSELLSHFFQVSEQSLIPNQSSISQYFSLNT